jgi:hypothetical protein
MRKQTKQESSHHLVSYGDIEDCFSAYIPSRKKKAKPTKDEVQSVFDGICQQIDETSKAILASKYNKISGLLLETVSKLIHRQIEQFV